MQKNTSENKQKELEVQLLQLNKESIDLFAARFALLFFPILVPTSKFSLWKSEKEVEYLLLFWANLLIPFSKYKLKNFPLSSVEEAFKAGDKSTSSTTTLSAEIAFGAISAINTDIVEKASMFTAISVIASVDMAEFYSIDLHPQIERTFSILKHGGKSELKSASLFSHSRKPLENNYMKLVEQDFATALHQLTAKHQSSEPTSVGILNLIWPIFMGIFHGQPDQKAIDETLEELEDYFSYKNIEDKESNKLFYGKDNELFYEKNDDIESISGNRHNSDKPANKDKLNRQKLVDSLATLLKDQNNHHHQTIGLLGHWGVGKTSVIELLKEALRPKKLENNPEFLFAEFNAWEYEHTDNLQAGIAQEMIKALSSREPKPSCWETTFWPFRKLWLTLRFAWSLHGLKILAPLLPLFLALAPIWFSYLFKEQFNQINESITYIFATTWFIGFLFPTWKEIKKILVGPMAKEFLTYLKLPDYGEHLGTIPVMREHIKKLTKVRLSGNKRLLYVVDDLDRCGHKGIVKVLEAVRMVLDLDNVIVVIAVDQRIALAALALNYKELATQHHSEEPKLIARDYLAKIIHLPIVLTEPDESSVLGYLESLWKTNGSQKSEEPKSKAEIGDKLDYSQTKSADHFQEPSFLQITTTSNQTEPTSSITQLNTSEPLSEPDSRQAIIHKVRQVEQLTKRQKQAFSYWLKHFELSNPRQIKRLNNSFNLLQNFYDQDKIADEITAKDAGTKHAFPMMVTLFAFEYLNNLDEMQKRHTLKKLIKKEKIDSEGADKKYLTDHKITPLVIELANIKTTMIQGIEPFVLPGIDVIIKAKPDQRDKNHLGLKKNS